MVNWEAITALAVFFFTIIFGVIGWFVNTTFNLIRQSIESLRTEVSLLRESINSDKLELRDKFVTKEEFYREIGYKKAELLK
jgi:hypothetical protein